MIAKLGLGTVQFGLDYGISNQSGQTPYDEVVKILAVARNHDIKILDTAALYGNSEETLGKAVLAEDSFSIVTKTPRFEASVIGSSEIHTFVEVFQRSLTRLNRSSVYGLLMHNVNDLFLENGVLLFDQMVDFKKQGLVEKIGVSVYTGEQIDRVLDYYPIDLIQVPMNVLDQRLIQSGHLRKLKKLNVEIHARSAFLQGLLLMDPEKLPSHFDLIRVRLKSYFQFLCSKGFSPVQGAIQFVMAIPEVDQVICGVNDHLQLQEICAQLFNQVNLEEFEAFASNDDRILNPSNWRN
jgi:aryl-alcohol dehydrogenase-like predicted oxidoreductase